MKKNENITFGQLLSAPAQVGRILNYIILSGNDKLFYGSNRNTSLKNNIGDEWCINFMVGLGICYISTEDKKVILTDKANEIYKIIKNEKKYPEGISKKVLEEIKTNLVAKSKNVYDIFFEIFINSTVTREAFYFLVENKTFCFECKKFRSDFFSAMKEKYKDESSGIRVAKKQNAGFNRVASFTKLCEFFGCLTIEGESFIFQFPKEYFDNIDFSNFKKTVITKTEKKKQPKKIDVNIQNLIAKYGIDGNTLSKFLVRNSNIQKKFKHNLLVEFKNKCCMCNINIEKMLIGSHIKPSCDCNLEEKIDEDNGLLLCCNHDKLFDSHLITFDYNNGKIKISKDIISHHEMLGIEVDFQLPNSFMTAKRVNYLKIHNEKFDDKNR